MGFLRRLLAVAFLAALLFAGAEERTRIEEQTEALDHLLLTLTRAALAKDIDAMAACATRDLVLGEIPSPHAVLFETREVHPTRKARDFALDLRRFLDEHGRLRSVRFKAIRSVQRGDSLHVDVRLEVVGATEEGLLWSRSDVTVFTKEGGIRHFVFRSCKVETGPRALFTDRAVPAGMAFTDPAAMDHPTLGLAAYGAAAADVNGDGRMDLLSTAHDTNRLYLNNGDGTFQLREVKSPRVATGPLFLDYDNDGDPDLFLSANGEQMLLENRDGSFHDVSAKMGVAVRSIGFSAVAGDINADGRADIYVAAYNNYGPVAPDSWEDGRNGLANLLFVSQEDGTYREEAKRWGVEDTRWSYAAQFVDIDEDGKLDLYVANDFGAGNGLFLNQGDRFVDAAADWGARFESYSMGVSFGDYDNDGRLDLHVTAMSSVAGNRILAREGRVGKLEQLAEGNVIFRNAGGRFVKTAHRFQAGWAWGGGFFDLDNDGRLDLYTPNGHMSNTTAKDT